MNAHAARIQLHRYGATYRTLLDGFTRLGGATPTAIAEFQRTRLQAIARVVAHSPFYRARLRRAGLTAADLAEPGALGQLPLLEKDELRAELPQVLTADAPQRGWLHGHTSGTTGSPLSLWYDRTTCAATNAADRLQKRWAGVDDEAWIGLLLGRQVVPVAQQHGPYWQVNFLQRQVWFSSLHLSPATLPAYVREIRRRGLTALEGYPSTLYLLARFLLDHGDRLPMRAVFTSSETLHDVQRDAIRTAFEAPLFDFYGHAERAIFAIECPEHDGKHLVEPYGITEVVDANGHPVPDGHFGYLVGTSLFNTAMPLLRYRTSDISSISRQPCACGSSFPRITAIATKAEDIVVLPDGRWLSPSALTHPFKPFPELVASQIRQEAPDRIVVRLVAGADFTAEREAQLACNLRERFGTTVQVHLERVPHIPRERSGKFRWVVSSVADAVQVDWNTVDARGPAHR